MQLQYLDTLNSEKEQKFNSVKELEEEIAKLRKNPIDKIRTDLEIYQLNRKINTLKEEISQIDKERYKVEKYLKELDTSTLDQESASLLEERFAPEKIDEIEELEDVTEEVVNPVKEEKPSKMTLTKYFKTLFNPAYMLILGVLSVISLCFFIQIDNYNLISKVFRHTRISFFVGLFSGIFTIGYVMQFAFKNISTKKIGSFSDYLTLYCITLSLFLILSFFIESSLLKLIAILGLLVFSITYIACRLFSYQKDLDKFFKNTNKLLNYYYTLFKKYNLFLIYFLSATLIIVVYVLCYTFLPKFLLLTSKVSKTWLIIDVVLLALAFLYYAMFSIIRLKEHNLKVIDLLSLLLQIISVQFIIFRAIFKLVPCYNAFYVIFAIVFITSVTITILRIINHKKDV